MDTQHDRPAPAHQHGCCGGGLTIASPGRDTRRQPAACCADADTATAHPTGHAHRSNRGDGQCCQNQTQPG